MSFTVDGVHPYDFCKFLDLFGVAARSGHHCAMPYLNALGVEHSVRFSLAPYNTIEDIQIALEAAEKVDSMLQH